MLQIFAFLFFCESTMIRLQDQVIRVDLAKTESQQMRGLMGRAKLDDGEGMLFVYEEPRILRFWMKGMKIPISIGFFDEQKVLINISEMPLPEKREYLFKEYYSSKVALYALEMPSGWFDRYNIAPGARFEWSEQEGIAKLASRVKKRPCGERAFFDPEWSFATSSQD